MHTHSHIRECDRSSTGLVIIQFLLRMRVCTCVNDITNAKRISPKMCGCGCGYVNHAIISVNKKLCVALIN